jgi:hypothetical protein
MTILTKERLAGYGPFVDFLELQSNGQTRHLAAWADSLLDVYCSITNQYLPFDPYFAGELDKRATQRLAGDLFGWCAHLANCRLDANDVAPLINLYIKDPPVEHLIYEAALEELRRDLVETASALATDLLKVWSLGNTCVIEGI